MFDPAAAARRIDEDRLARRRFRPISAPDRPVALSDAYRTQELYVERLAVRLDTGVAGWKIGLTSPRMQRFCGVDQPIAGAVLARRVMHSPATVVAAEHIRLGVESEIAVRLATDLPGGGARPVTPEEAGSAVGEAAAAFELVDDADADYAALDAASIVADGAWNAGLVLGPPSPHQGGGLAGRAGVLLVDGAEVDRGESDDVLGEPLRALAWLADHLAARGNALRAGDWVTTGSLVTTRFVRPGERLEFRVDGLSTVRLDVA